MIVFLSPHLDDAIFSCGAHIAHLAEDNHLLTILTIMAGDPPDPLPTTPLVEELHVRWEAGANPIAARRLEDRNAADALATAGHIETAYMPIPDCVYRTHNGQALYPIGDDDLFGPIHPDDPAQTLLAATNLPDIGASIIYAPLGVGNHVDHQLVRDWALQLKDTNPGLKLYFYAEYPYSSDPHAIDAALEKFNHSLEQVRLTLKDTDLAKWVEAAGRYTSQINTFWPDKETMQKQMHTYLKILSNNQEFAQSYWQPTAQEMN